MRNNKILTAAIASALSLSAGSAFAAQSISLMQPQGGTAVAGLTTPVANALTFASELFPAANIASSGTAATAFVPFTADAFVVRYDTGLTGSVGSTASMVITATLSGGTWGRAIEPTAQVALCATPTIQNSVGPTVATIACSAAADAYAGLQISKGTLGGIDNNSVEFFIQPAAVDIKPGSAFLFFSFNVDDLTSFQGSGGLSLTMDTKVYSTLTNSFITIGSSLTQPIAASASGLSVNITPDTTPGVVAIDVTKDSKQFLVGTTNPTPNAISLGKVQITTPTGSTKVLQSNGSTQFSFKTGCPTATGTLVVQNGIFSASTAGNVFLDDGNGTLNVSADPKVPADIPATKIADGTQAQWDLTKEQLYKIFDTAGGMKLYVLADGALEIIEQSQAPLATLTIKCNSTDAVGKTYPPRRLRHVKENGTKCTLFNIPDATPGGGSIDGVSVRVTNKTANAGQLFASLYRQDGTAIYKSKLIGAVEPKSTVRFNTGEGDEFDLTLVEGGPYRWPGERAVLRLSTDLQDVEMFGLVRNITGGPSMNVSTGATGNGCD